MVFEWNVKFCGSPNLLLLEWVDSVKHFMVYSHICSMFFVQHAAFSTSVSGYLAKLLNDAVYSLSFSKGGKIPRSTCEMGSCNNIDA